MDETTLRQLADELLIELPATIPDPTERTPVADAIESALAAPEGQGSAALLGALSTNSRTRRWMREHGAVDDVVRGGLYGDPPTPFGLYYVCPQEDEDEVLLSVPPQPPRCTVHDIPMILQG